MKKISIIGFALAALLTMGSGCNKSQTIVTSLKIIQPTSTAATRSATGNNYGASYAGTVIHTSNGAVIWGRDP